MRGSAYGGAPRRYAAKSAFMSLPHVADHEHAIHPMIEGRRCARGRAITLRSYAIAMLIHMMRTFGPASQLRNSIICSLANNAYPSVDYNAPNSSL
jgi:hypothetical protein